MHGALISIFFDFMSLLEEERERLHAGGATAITCWRSASDYMQEERQRLHVGGAMHRAITLPYPYSLILCPFYF